MDQYCQQGSQIHRRHTRIGFCHNRIRYCTQASNDNAIAENPVECHDHRLRVSALASANTAHVRADPKDSVLTATQVVAITVLIDEWVTRSVAQRCDDGSETRSATI